MKSVLITGVRGFIGSALKLRFESEGYQVAGINREDSHRICDILSMIKPGLILHGAAEAYDVDSMFESNVVLTHSILEHCRERSPNCRLVVIGSSSEYGRKSCATKETDSLEPGTVYEGTKAAASMLTRAYAIAYQFPAVIIRPYSIYGPGENPRKFLQQLIRRPRSIELCPTPVHDFVYIDDFVDAVFAVLGRQSKLFDVVNVGSGIQTSNQEAVCVFERVLNHRYKIDESLAPKENDASVWVCDPSYLLSAYGFRTKIALEDGVRRMAVFAQLE